MFKRWFSEMALAKIRKSGIVIKLPIVFTVGTDRVTINTTIGGLTINVERTDKKPKDNNKRKGNLFQH